VHGASPPSPWFLAQRDRLREAAALGPLLDLACGRGRHALAAAELGIRSLGIDRDALALRALAAQATARALPLAGVRADLETPMGIPVRAGSCGAILVFRFLFLPLAPAIVASLAPGGLLVYETFLRAQRSLGTGPRRTEFLLEPGDLRRLFVDLEPLAYTEGRSEGSPPEFLARLAARKPRQASSG
jgi:SAM-dependent methyltransferase